MAIRSNLSSWTLVTAGACLALASAILLILVSWLSAPPSPEEANALATPNRVVAFSTSARRPNLLMIDGDRLVFDRLRLSWEPVAEGSMPSWRRTAHAYRIQRTPTPASAAVVACAGDTLAECDRSIAVVGELTQAGITHIEIAVDGAWERHLVFGQGFIVPIDRRRLIGDIRWLSVRGEEVRLVWAIDRDMDGQIAPRTPGQLTPTDVRRLQSR